MAWLSDEPMIYDTLAPMDYLEFVAGVWSVDSNLAEGRAREVRRWLDMEPYAHDPCEGLSKPTQ